MMFSGNKAVGGAAQSTGSASCQWQWLWGFSRVGFGVGTSVNRTGRDCLADLKLGFFCVKEVKPLDFWGVWSCCGVVTSSCSSVTHSAPVLSWVWSRNPSVHPAAHPAHPGAGCDTWTYLTNLFFKFLKITSP